MGYEVVGEAWSALVAAVLPVECAGCGEQDVAFCSACRDVLAGPGRLTAPPPVADCPPVYAVTSYEGVARAVLVAWKDHGRHDLGDSLAGCLAAAVRSGPWGGPVLLVPVPSARRAVRRRGEDLVGGLARRAAAQLRRGGADVGVAAVLRQRRRVRDQAGLGAGDRAANLQGALGLRRGAGLGGYRCVLVDDVVTTGATLVEARRAVTAAGGSVLGAAVVAATPRRVPSSGPHGALRYRVDDEWTSVSAWQASPR